MKNNWQTKTLGEVLEKTETVNPSLLPNKDFTYVDVSGVSNETFTIENSVVLNGKDAPSRARKQIREGDIIFATVRPTLKRIAVVPEELNGQVCSTGYFVLRGKKEIFNPLLFYYLLSDDFNNRMLELQRGASYPAVTDGDVKQQLISFPESLPEQRRIVAILDDIFERVTKAKANAEKNLLNAKEVFESYLQKVFAEPGDDWEEKTLSEVASTFGRGKSKHRPRNDKSLYGGKYPFIQTGDIRNSEHYITEYTQTYNEKGLAQSKLWPKGTICITIAANIAETGILAFDSCFPDSVIGLVANPKLAETSFIEYLLQFFKTRIQAMGKGSAQANINMATFEYEVFPFPSVSEQRTIVANLDALSTETKQLEAIYRQKLSSLEELEKSVLRSAFRGEL